MNKRKIIGYLLQAPLLLTFIGGILAQVYVIYTNAYPITIITPIAFTIMTLLYFFGVFLIEKKGGKNVKPDIGSKENPE